MWVLRAGLLIRVMLLFVEVLILRAGVLNMCSLASKNAGFKGRAANYGHLLFVEELVFRAGLLNMCIFC